MLNRTEPGCQPALPRLPMIGVAFAAALAIPMAVAPSPAPAAEATFQVNSISNEDAVYDIYEVFKADIGPNTGEDAGYESYAVDEWPGVATHVTWVDAETKNAILGFLDANGYPSWLEEHGHTENVNGVTPREVPQNAAEFVAERIGASPNDDDAAMSPPSKAARSFALELAKAMHTAGIEPQTANANQPFSGETGYYLFVTDDDSIGVEEAGTSPIWVPLGGATASIDEKSDVPSLEKEVKEDSTGEFGHAADADRDQELEFRLTGTMPKNIGSFDEYHYKFTDTLPKGMTLEGNNTASVNVSIDGKDVTDKIEGHAGAITYRDNVLVVDMLDILTLDVENCPINKDSVVIVDYKAHLNEDSIIGPAGNKNTAVLTYTKNPVSESDGNTVEKETRTFTYQLSLHKVDKQTGENLAHAKFTIADQDGNYVQADGSLAETPYEFETDEQGLISVPRIDEGSYTVKEVHAPDSYELQDADIAIMLETSLDQTTGKLTSWNAEVSGGEGAASRTNDSEVVTHLDESQTSFDAGIVFVQTSDEKKLIMPITGMEGTSVIVALAGIGAIASIIGLARNRSRRRDGAAEDGTTRD